MREVGRRRRLCWTPRVMIRPAELAAIRDGRIDLAFRRWEAPRVKVGTRMRTAVGVLEVTSVDRVSEQSLTAEQAERAGAASLPALKQALALHPERPVYQVGMRYAGDDPRSQLRQEIPDEEEIVAIKRWLDRLDAASSSGPWTWATLRLIDENPATRAPELAARLGRDTPTFKRDVRKLKERGLTESLDIGYRLSPRGAAVVDHPGPPRERPAVEPGTPLPRIGAPATRALTAHGVTRLEQLSGMSAAELSSLHGVGPVAVARLREAMRDAGMALREE